MSKFPDYVSGGEVTGDPIGLSARWGEGSTGFALVLDATGLIMTAPVPNLDGQKVHYRVYGPVMARFFATLAKQCGVPFEEIGLIAKADAVLTPFYKDVRLRRHGFLLFCEKPEDMLNSSVLVVVSDNKKGWPQYLDEAYERFG